MVRVGSRREFQLRENKNNTKLNNKTSIKIHIHKTQITQTKNSISSTPVHQHKKHNNIDTYEE